MMAHPDDGGGGGGGDNHDNSHDNNHDTRRYHDPDPPPRHPTPYDVRIGDPSMERFQDQVREWYLRNPDYFDHIDTEVSPQPPSLAGLWGKGYRWWLQSQVDTLWMATFRAGRRLTPDERYVFATHISRGLSIASWDVPVALGAGAALVLRGWDSWSFLGYKPSFRRFNPNTFPSPRWSLLRGALARTAWRGTNVAATATLGYGLYEWAGLGERWTQRCIEDAWQEGLESDFRLSHLAHDIVDNFKRLGIYKDDDEPPHGS